MAGSNLRAANYSIPPADRHKVRVGNGWRGEEIKDSVGRYELKECMEKKGWRGKEKE